MRLALASDHGGFALKQTLKTSLGTLDVDIVDLGVNTADAVDYPEKAHDLSETILSKKADLGVLICGTGIGVSIAANRHPGIRAALCTDPFMARMSRAHNDANILCLGGRVVGPGLALEIVSAFLEGAYEGGRHARRLEKIDLK
ncbi:MAG: ribose 5-phosphate isomerase B [Myxococcota bacterium]|nr:ribose 5-phosphate isomerase B [Myxococcota bacterium]